MVFQMEGSVISKVCGPVFDREVQRVKEMFFNLLPGETFCLEETAFATRYLDRYHEHLYFYWMDKVNVYLSNNVDWIGKYYVSKEPSGFAGAWFHMFEVTEPGENGVERIRIKINTSITADPFIKARLLHEIVRILPHNMILGKPYYNGSDKRLHLGDSVGAGRKSGAYQRYLAESLVNHCCLT